MKKIIITGITGSIGSELQKLLQVNNEVISLDPRIHKFPDSKAPAFTKFDVLIIAHGGDGEILTEIYRKNVFNTSKIIKEAKKYLNKDGCIIVITSRRALRPTEIEWHYSAGKAAVHAYVRALYKSNPQLRITAIAPGWVESKMAQKGNAQRVIAIKELCNLIKCIINSPSMRIPEIFIEPVGDSEF